MEGAVTPLERILRERLLSGSESLAETQRKWSLPFGEVLVGRSDFSKEEHKRALLLENWMITI